TGTPPRIDGRSVDFNAMRPQPGDSPAPVFSFVGRRADHPQQVACHITHTTAETHALIRGALDRSPLYTGMIEGVGPRYCPSIEDKIVRFADKESHQIFVEPEGLTTTELYPNGISTSLPFDVQQALVRTIPGFNNARITRPGYAIEYDYFDPRGLTPTLETKSLRGLWFAGQINGTTGYEEAGAQGLVAGINAALTVRGEAGWYPRRDEAYIGVLIDDLITRGTSEPYRMFTSRAEYRLLLREDNADARLTPVGRRLGLVDDLRFRIFTDKQAAIETERERLAEIMVRPADLPNLAGDNAGSELRREHRALELLRRPEISWASLTSLPAVGARVIPAEESAEVTEQIIAQIETEARYAGYVKRQQEEIVRARASQEVSLPPDLDYAAIHGLSHEIRQKLDRHRPATVGQASRISGVTPVAVSLLLVHLKKRRPRR
ncbi:MAG: tRNA uridine-5-carboxymethylaminomethyl(34) synthesis enzyme MnmG, partial [Gammaproteobacteria bacterium]|nr:tRNA uridine-5-carboxymethylaminomethyl(34) synthesis enzyme MnmG [Gammaproteobacteria bacterium]